MKKTSYLLLLGILTLWGCTTPARIVFFNAPSIEDSRIFSADTVHAAQQPFAFAKRAYTPLPPVREWIKHPIINEYYSLEEFLIRTKTTSFLVIRNDTIIYENYFNSFDVDKPAIVFSVSKSITTALVGIAIKEGYIKNINQKVSDFIPEFALDRNIHLFIDKVDGALVGQHLVEHGGVGGKGQCGSKSEGGNLTFHDHFSVAVAGSIRVRMSSLSMR